MFANTAPLDDKVDEAGRTRQWTLAGLMNAEERPAVETRGSPHDGHSTTQAGAHSATEGDVAKRGRRGSADLTTMGGGGGASTAPLRSRRREQILSGTRSPSTRHHLQLRSLPWSERGASLERSAARQ